MGFVDAVALLDTQETQFIYWYSLNEYSPPVDYVRELLPDFTKSDPIFKLDKDWIVAWRPIDNFILITIGSNTTEFVDVISDEEDNSSDEEEDEGESADQCEHQNLTSDNDEQEDHQKKEDKGSDKSFNLTTSISVYPNPAQYFSFMSIFIDSVNTFLNTDTFNRQKIKLNSHKISMLLHELIDAGVPFVTDVNQLREHIPSDSILNTIISTTKQIQNSASTSLANFKQGGIGSMGSNLSSIGGYNPGAAKSLTYSIALEKSGYPTPWRKAIVKHTQNELFVDLVETIDLIVSSNPVPDNTRFSYSSNYAASTASSLSQYSKATINGKLALRSSITGQSVVTINLDSPLYTALNSVGKEGSNLFNSSVMLHRCVDKYIWRDSSLSNSRQLQCIPPDGKSTLLQYTIDIIELDQLSTKVNSSKGYFNMHKFLGLVEVDLIYGLGNPIGDSNIKNEFEIIVKTGLNDSVKEIQNLIIDINLPMISKTQDYDLRIIRSSSGSLMKNNKGIWQWSLDSPVILGATFTLRCSINDPSSNSNSSNFYNNGNQDQGFKFFDASYNTQNRSHWKHNAQILQHDNNKLTVLKPTFLNVKYSYKGGVFTGTKIKNIDIFDDGELGNTKPFKGVKYNASSTEFIVK